MIKHTLQPNDANLSLSYSYLDKTIPSRTLDCDMTCVLLHFPLLLMHRNGWKNG